MERWQYDKIWPWLTTTAYKSLTGQSSNAHLLFPDSELISECLQSLTELHIMIPFIVMKYTMVRWIHDGLLLKFPLPVNRVGETLETWRLGDGWAGCAFPGTQIPRTFSGGSVFRPSHWAAPRGGHFVAPNKDGFPAGQPFGNDRHL